MDLVFLKKNFRVTFQPKPERIKPYLRSKNLKRFTLNFDKLPDLIGEERTEFIIKKVMEMKEDKKRFKVQDKGIVDVYCI